MRRPPRSTCAGRPSKQIQITRALRCRLPSATGKSGVGRKLEPILEMLVRKQRRSIATGWSPLELYYRAGHCALQLNNLSKARSYYKSALEVDNVHLPSLLEAADVYAELSEWDLAYEAYNAALIVQRGHNQSTVELARTLFKMGRTRSNAGDTDGALTLYESALDAGPCPEALAAVTELYTARRDFAAVVQAKRSQLVAANGGDKVVAALRDCRHHGSQS